MQSRYEHALEALKRRGRLRKLEGRDGLDFTSNDYLGFAESETLQNAVREALDRGVPVGAGGSRLLRGNHPEHEALEAEAARFFGTESALYFGSGFAANSALMSTLPQRGDLVVHDALIHASARDGLAASKAEVRECPHNDAGQIADILSRWRADHADGRCFVAIESLYSMDGDVAPLQDLARVASRYDATLLIDEAHATGVRGPQGRGLAAHLEGSANVVSLHTCGKALGASGALLLMPEVLRRFMINRCRSFIYATAPSPLMAATVRTALKLCADADDARAALELRVTHFSQHFARMGLPSSSSQIQPIVLGADRRAVAAATALAADGFDVRAVRPPTVPEGTSRLRITLGTRHALSDLDALAGRLAHHLRDLAA
jgi:8-amino-7-oxononanoate synthase